MVRKKEREEKITNGQIPINHRSCQQRILKMAPIRTGRTKAESAKVPSCARKRASAEKKKELPLSDTLDATCVYEARPRAANDAATQ